MAQYSITRGVKWAIWGLLLVFLPAQAQRQGSVEVGGYLEYANNNDSNENTENILNLKVPVGFYFSRKMLFEIEPMIDLTFNRDRSNIKAVVLLGPSYQIADLFPPMIEQQYYRDRDVGTSAAIFTSVRAGFWSEGFAEQDEPGKNHSGMAASVGIGTRSSIGHRLFLRSQMHFLYLFPSGEVYNFSRTILSFSIGLSTIVKF
ncbi:MAG TPA: hypothetical protein PKN04_01765 [bacterium]|jgi:hypothetical protein|nr:hypothetical protein [bacterium]HNT64486.1 hypothetical protein [bacterium]HOX84668.1 hypothetical protein [bacterium]HPG45391.1 hypothetical protein [bacterium]HPM96833.1 hypothetical protein [bacterium]